MWEKVDVSTSFYDGERKCFSGNEGGVLGVLCKNSFLTDLLEVSII